jgi:hypothetical protein
MPSLKPNHWRLLPLAGLVFVLQAISQMSYAGCVPSPAGVIGWWGGEASAADYAGLLGGESHGETFAAGKVGQAFVFDGASSHVLVPDSPLLSPHVGSSGEMTLEAWFYMPQLPDSDTSAGVNARWLVSKGAASQWEYGLYLTKGGEPGFVVWQSSGSVYGEARGSAVSTNEWHHVAGVLKKGTFVRLYVDGQLVTETTGFNGDTSDGNSPMYIGRRGDGLSFNGSVDEVTLYGRALGGAEVGVIYAAGSEGKCVTIPGAAVPYTTGFESGIGSEWMRSALNNSETLAFTQFSGRFGNEAQMLTLTNLIPGQSYTLGFDFYAIDSWDGEPSDYLNVDINGRRYFSNSFANYNGTTQSFPGQPDEGRANFGFILSFVDAIYRNVEVTFTATNAVTIIQFSGQGLQNLDDESWGIDNVTVRLSAEAAVPWIHSTSLPVSGSTNYVALDQFVIAASQPLASDSATAASSYVLSLAGTDGVFGTADDVVIPVTASIPGVGGHSVLLSVNAAPLQPGLYQFVASGLRTTGGSVVLPYTNTFVIANPAWGTIETPGNDTLSGAGLLTLTESPAGSGLFSGVGIGEFTDASDVDYWKFDAEAGDVVSVRLEAELVGVYSQMALRNSSDGTLSSSGGDYSGAAQIQNYTIPTPGSYYLRVWSDNRRSRYSMRVDISRLPSGPQLEAEGNDSGGTANVLVQTASSGLYQARVAGVLPSLDASGDYFDLGILNAGNSISLAMQYPASSTLGNQAILSVWRAGGTNAVAGSVSGILNCAVAADGDYWVHVESTNRDLRASYLLTVAVSDTVPPRITGASLPEEGMVTTALVNGFSLNFSESMDPLSVGVSSNYTLVCAGADGVFGTGDDAVYRIAANSYAQGTTASYMIVDGPMQPGNYRFSVSANLKDRAANAMGTTFARNFQVANLSVYTFEGRSNDVAALATPLSAVVTTNGDGTAGLLQTVAAGYPRFVIAGHFGGGTNLDIAYANWGDGGISVATNGGGGLMTVMTNIATGNNPASIVSADFNQDGFQDLAVANYSSGTVTVVLGGAGGQFHVLTNIAGFSGPYNLAVADLNGDGRVDLVVPNSGSGYVTILNGRGDGNFDSQPVVTTGSYCMTAAVGDVNGDGKPDIVTANYSSATVSVLTNDGSGVFLLSTNLSPGSNPRYVAVYDVTGDNIADVVALVPGNNTIAVFAGNGDGTFKDRLSYVTGTTDAYQFQLADMNGDGRKDVVVGGFGNSQVSVLWNSGGGVFTTGASFGVRYPMSLAIEDFNGDGVWDLAIAQYYDACVGMWQGYATGSPTESPAGSGVRSVAARGNRSSSSDVDYYRFSGTAGDLAVVAVEMPSHVGASSLRFDVQTADGSTLTTFYSDYYGYGQSANLTLPKTGTYLVRVTANYDFQGEYRLRVTMVRPPMQLESEGNDEIANANGLSFVKSTDHLSASVAGYIGYNDGGDFHYLGNLLGGATVSIGERQPSDSGLAAILSIYYGSGELLTNSAAGAAGLSFTVPEGKEGAYYAAVTAAAAGSSSSADTAVSLNSSGDSLSFGAWMSNQVFTLSLQVNPSASQGGSVTLIENAYSDGTGWAIRRTDTANQYAWMAGDGSPAIVFTLQPGVWQQVTVARDSTNVNHVYVNGNSVGSSAGSGQINYASNPAMTIGDAPSGGRNWGGMVNDVRLWDRGFSAAEAADGVSRVLSGGEAGLLGYWPLNEGRGGTSADLTASNHVVSLVGGAAWVFLGPSGAAAPGVLSQYILDVTLGGSGVPRITGTSLPAEGTTVSNLWTSFTVGFNEDMDPAFTRLTRSLYRHAGKTYLVTDASMSWADAEAAAVKLGGHLASIHSDVENAWIFQTFTPVYGDVWIGANDRAGFGVFGWTDGKSFDYSNWSGGEPNNNSGGETVVRMYSGSGVWGDCPASDSLRGVIVIDSTADADGDGWVDGADPYPGDPLNVFDLREAGIDGMFDTADDVVYRVVCGDYSAGMSAVFNIVDGPLQPGSYRFEVTTALRNRFGAPLASIYSQRFAITSVAGFIEQGRRGTNGISITSLSLSTGTQPDSSFSVNSSIALQSYPYRVISGDFNKDGSPDLAYVNFGSSSVAILTNNGLGQFSVSTNMGGFNGPICLATADFNADGKLDLAVANYYGNTVAILPGDGHGGLTVSTNLTGFSNPRNLAVGDFNHDGIPDLVVPNQGAASVSVLLGTGGGVFADKVSYSVGNNPETVVAADLDGDGNADLVVVNYWSASLSVLKGAADGTFTAAVSIDTVSNPHSVAVGDVTGDGKVDLVVVNNGGMLSLHPGVGDGTFGVRKDFSISSGDTYQVVLADVNGDGVLDFVVPGFGNNRLMTLINTGDGTVGSQMAYSIGGNPMSAVVDDFNKDGRVDIATANYYGANGSILFGNATQGLALDPAGTGLRIAAGRGNLADSSDYDYWTFSALGGDRLSIATESVGLPGGSGLLYRLYSPDGSQLTYFYSDYTGLADVSVTAPVPGTYTLRVERNYSYSGEYRFRVSLARPPVQLETEDNNSLNNANVLSYSLTDGRRTALAQGCIGLGDGSGDYFQLGNLASGTEVSLSWARPSTSRLAPILELYNASGTLLTNSTPDATNLSYTLGVGESGVYYAHVAGSYGARAPGLERGLYFSANSTRVDVGAWAPGTQWSLQAWAMPTSLPSDRRTIVGGLGGCRDWAIVMNNGYFAADVGYNGCVTYYAAPFRATVGTWYHLAVSCDGTNACFYVNGQLVNSGPVDVNYSLYPGGAWIGGESCCGGYFPGLIQDVSIWQRVLSGTEINGFMASNATGAETGLMGLWTLRDGLGDTAPDLSGNGRAGALVNGPTWVTLAPMGSLSSGLFQQYLLSVGLKNSVPPRVLAVSLPDEGASTGSIVDRFTVTFSEDMASGSVTNAANYSLVGAGADGLPGTADDLVYTVLNTPAYTSGTSATYYITDGPLQPGLIRLVLSSNITDPVGTCLVTDYTRSFVVTNVAGYTFENRAGNNMGQATSLSPARGAQPDGTLAVGAGLDIGGTVERLAAGYIDGDSTLDVVAAQWNSGRVAILLGDGKGGFTVKTNYPTGNGTWSVVLGHFDDGNTLDLAVVNYYSSLVTVFLGNGDGTFQPGVSYPTGTNPYHVVAADVNGDGKSDLIIPNWSGNNVSVLLGNGDGTFQPKTDFVCGLNPAYVAVGDVNGDGMADVLTANYGDNDASLLLGLGDGSFAAPVTIAAGTRPRTLVAADLNADGKLDMAVLNGGDNTVSVMLGNGDGSFRPRVNYPAGTSDGYEILARDFNGDGSPDLVMGGYNNSTVNVAFNAGDGAFGAVASYSLNNRVVGLVAGDFTGDGRLDLAAGSDNASTVTVLEGSDTQSLVLDASTGLRMGAGRGTISADSQVDYWSFDALSNDLLTVAAEVPGNISGGGLYFRVYRPDGRQIGTFYGDYNGRGQGAFTCPIAGTYTVAVSRNYNYNGEYRLRVTLARPPMQAESEDNGSLSSANSLSYDLSGDHRKATVLGYSSSADNGDFFQLGSLGDGASIALSLNQPANSGLAGVLAILDSNGSVVTSSPVRAAALNYTVPAGASGDYYAMVLDSGIVPGPKLGGVDGYALRFWGGDWVAVTNGVIPGSGDYTVECWAYAATPSSYREIISQGTGGNAFYLGTDGSWIRAGDSWGNVGVAFPFQGWHHFAVVKTASDARVYVDGVLAATRGGTIANPSAGEGFRIGRQYGSYGEYWLGLIDEVRVWNVAREASDIAANYSGRLTGTETGLVGYWRMDEGNGRVALDRSPSGNNGAFVGMPSYVSTTISNVSASGVFSQYVLGIDVAQTNALTIAASSLPAAGQTSSGIFDSFTLTFPRDINTEVNNVTRDIRVYNGHGYTVTAGYVSWYDAEQQALALGGHLATINDAAENDWVTANFGGYGSLWIGLTDEIQKNTWGWVDGSAAGYFNWRNGQPSGANEDYVCIYGDSGEWGTEYGSSSWVRGLIEVTGTDSDGDGIPDSLDPYPHDRFNGFDLRSSGNDGVFDSADDVVYRASLSTYAGGQTLTFSVSDGPLQPGSYRFTMTTSVRDLFGNTLSAPYVQYFTVTNLAGYVVESRTNDTAASAMPLAWTQDPAGLKTVAVRGDLRNSADNDWYSFEASAGDVLNLAVFIPGMPGGSQLHYQVYGPDGSRILDYYPSYYGDGEASPLTLASTGVYKLMVSYNYNYFKEYRVRLTLATPPVQMESEGNDSIGAASTVNLVSDASGRSASVIGRVRTGSDLDYFNLGMVTNGSSIILNVRQPSTSPLAPVVSVYDASGVYQTEISGARSSDGFANVPITVTGNYYAIVRSSGGLGGLDYQYILDINVVPTGSVNFPNLVVSSVTPPGGDGILSGQGITYAFNVANIGTLATAVGSWNDRAVLSQDGILGNSDDIALGVFPHNGVLGVGGSYGMTNQFRLPDGISGDYHIIVQTDSGSAVNEYLFKGDNVTVSTDTFHVSLAPYSDLTVEDLTISAPTNFIYTVTWNLANRGTLEAPAGFHQQVGLRNKTTGEILSNEDAAMTNSLGTNAIMAMVRHFTLTNPGLYQIEITADSLNGIYEFNSGGHAAAEANNSATNTLNLVAYYTVALTGNPAGAGSLAGAGTFASGTAVTVSAAPVTGDLPYVFVNWTENGAFQSASPSYTFLLSRDRSLTANFTLPAFLIAASNNPPGAGVVSGQGSYFYGTTNVMVATANFGYKFANWTENGAIVGTSPFLTNIVHSNRVVVANYTEANTTHIVTTATLPGGIATVTGGGTYGNGDSATVSAPVSVTNPPSIFNFRHYQLNGVVVGTSPVFSKTFSTLDPVNMAYTAVYDTASILPRVTNVTINYTGTVPQTTNARIAFQFDRSMNPGVTPVVTMTNLSAGVRPTVPSIGTWSSTVASNDTFTTAGIVFSTGMDGSNAVWIAQAADLNGNSLGATNVVTLLVDATPPANPALAVTASNNVSATVSWADYAAPGDLNGFRIYIATNPFTSIAGMTAMSSVGAPARAFTFGGLSLDTPYYATVAAVDTAGNSSSAVHVLAFTLASSVPPGVAVRVTPSGAASAVVSWNGYDTSKLLGFAGFRLYYETTDFTTVTGHTVRQTLAADATSVQIDNLDRTRTYYFAVVGINGNQAFNPTVSTVSWKDPFAGTITSDTTISGTVEILQGITVGGNAVLTIPAGTTLRFAPGAGLTVKQGTVVASGTALDPVTFTSVNDQSGATANAGDWAGIVLGPGADKSVLRHVFVQYGAGVTVTNCSPTIDAFSALNNSGAGLTLCGNATLSTTNALVTGNDVGIQQLGAAMLSVTHSVIKNNATNALATGGLTLRAGGVWWGTTVAADIDATLRGAVDRAGSLSGEPLLTPSIGTVDHVTQVGAATVNLRLACRTADTMRLSEDSTFTSVFYSPFTNLSAFALSAGGGVKTVFAQFRSVTGQTSEPVSVSVTYITDGPTISSFNLNEGDVLTRPFFVNGEASAPMGMAAMEFYVDDTGYATNSGGSFLRWFDIRSLSVGTHRIRLAARDVSGNLATRQLNVVVSPTPPPSPYILVPDSDRVINSNRVDVAGSAEPFLTVQLVDSGLVLATTQAAANGSFAFPGVVLSEGANALVAQVTDALGSARSPARSVTVDTVAPAQLIMDAPAYQAGMGLVLSWHYPASGKRASAFQVFWSKTPVTSVSAATGHTILTTSTSTTIQGLADGTYYFYVVGYDAIGNSSPLSEPVTFAYDATPPSFSIGFDKASPVGGGALHVILTASENLAGAPTLTVQPYGQSPSMLTLSNSALNTYEGGMNVTALLPSGPVAFNVSATDASGNLFSGAPAGPAMVIDVTPPSGIVAVSSTPPIQTTNATSLALTLTLSESPKAGTLPELQFAPPTGSNIVIALSGSGVNWAGMLTLTPEMGAGFGHFILTVVDSLDNVGHSITSGSALELYNTAVPSAPGQPVNFHGAPLSGGQVALNWDPVNGAESYRVYCEAGSTFDTPTNRVMDDVPTNSATNLPSSDGSYRYVVTAVRRGAEGVPSIVRVVRSDRTPPPMPVQVQVQSVAQGLQITWKAGDGETADHYNIYRNGTLIRTTASVVPVIDYPPRGTMSYVVSSVDALGNEAAGDAADFILLVGAVRDLQVLLVSGQPAALSWTPTDDTTVGYNVYRNGVKQNSSVLAVPSYTDNLTPGAQAVTYSVTAVNATNAESVPRQVSVHSLGIGLMVNSTDGVTSGVPIAGYFDKYQVAVTNLSADAALPVASVEVQRAASGAAALTVSNTSVATVDALGVTTSSLVVPSLSVSGQSIRVRVSQQTDANGSEVIYQKSFTLSDVQNPGLMVEVRPNQLPLAGGYGSFTVTLYNRSVVPIYLATSHANASIPGDLYIVVKDPQGQEVSRGAYYGTPSGVFFDGDVGYVTIGAGSSTSLVLTNVLIPEAMASNIVTFQAVASVIYDRRSASGRQSSGPLSGSTQSSLTQTPYYGVAQTDALVYMNDQSILITGQAIDRATGMPVPNAPLKIGFAARGCVWYVNVTNDASGNFSYVYTPTRGFAGTLGIWAAHPLVYDRLNQVQVNVSRLYVSPTESAVRMSLEDSLAFSVSLYNPGDVDLSGFSLDFAAYKTEGTNQIPITTLSGEILSDSSFTASAGQWTTISLKLRAAADAPTNATAVFTLKSAQGASAVFRGDVTLSQPVPVLSVTSPDAGYVEVSLDRGNLVSRQVTVVNSGLHELKGVTLLPPTNVTWMMVNLATNSSGAIALPDIGVGQSNSFTMVFVPPTGTDLGFYQDKLTITGTNTTATFDVNLYARVTSASKGAVQFYVDNILGQDVPNASVRLRNLDLQVELTPSLTDINGLVTVTNLQEGQWSWQIGASGHSPAVGVVTVIPDQTVNISARLNKSVVTINFTVVPVPYTDRYEITLEQTFETHVPLPVLVLDPVSKDFDNVTAGFQANYIVTARNEGLVQMENLTITGSSDSVASLTPLITYVPALLPQETVEIPFTATYLGTNGNGTQGNPLIDCIPNPADIGKDIPGIIEGLRAIANAEGRCYKDNTMLNVAAFTLITMKLYQDISQFTAGWEEQVASYIGCVIGSLIGGGESGTLGGGSYPAYEPVSVRCFARGTPVLLADGSSKPIEAVSLGDVLRSGTRPGSVATVMRVLNLNVKSVRQITYGEQTIVVSDEHLLWVDGRGWVTAARVRPGEWFLTPDGGRVEVSKNETIAGEREVFTLKLGGDVAFFANGILVHDLCGAQAPPNPRPVKRVQVPTSSTRVNLSK